VNKAIERTADPRHGSCVRTCRATGTRGTARSAHCGRSAAEFGMTFEAGVTSNR
jgi:hypothetical protein